MNYGPKNSPGGVFGIDPDGTADSSYLSPIDALKIGNNNITTSMFECLLDISSNIQAQINAIASGRNIRGDWDASVNLFPAAGGSGVAGAILAGDQWNISVTGTLGGKTAIVDTFITALFDTPGQTGSNWSVPQDQVVSVFTRMGSVVAEAGDYNVSQITGAASTTYVDDGLATKASSTALALKADITYVDSGLAAKASTSDVTTALALKANLISPNFTGTPTAPTTGSSDNTTKIATTEFVQTGLNTKANTLDVNAALTFKAPLASPALTGTPTADTATQGTSTTQLATTAFTTIGLATKEPTITNLPATKGGTGIISYAIGDIPYATSTTALGKLAAVAIGSVYASGGIGAAPILTNAPAFGGNPTAPDLVQGDNSTKLANTKYVDTGLATKASTASVALKADIISPTFTGSPKAPTQATSDNSTNLATTAYITRVARTYIYVSASGNYNLASSDTLVTQSANNTTMRLPDASTTIYNTIYTINLISAAQNATITVPTGQYLNNVLNGVYTITATPGAVVSFRSNEANYWVQIDNVAALSLKAPIASPTFTGNVTAPNIVTSSMVVSSKGGSLATVDDSGLMVPSLAINNVNGLRLSWASATTLGLTAGYWNAINSSVMRNLNSAVTINIANVGVVNGLDTGAAANNTNYYVYALAHGTNSTLNGAILSTNATTPTLPSGYTDFRYIGRVRRNGSSSFIKFIQVGNATKRTTIYTDTAANTLFLSGAIPTTYTAGSLASFVPPGSTSGLMRYELDSTLSSSTSMSFRETGSSVAAGSALIRLYPGFTGFTSGVVPFVCNASQSIDYVISPSGNCNVSIYSYDEDL